jgi:hypothetical protein
MVTSMLPRVAFEYGQTACALSTMACATARSTPGTVTSICTSMPKPAGIWPMPTVAWIEVSAGSTTFCMPATNFMAPMKHAL